jgi:thioesterase domain-containing protein/acyl carrier protein
VSKLGEIEFVPPVGPVEEVLGRIWSELLGLERVGVQESFFDLGGDSLLAVHLFAQVEKVFGSRLPLATLAQGATIAELARALQQTMKEGATAKVVAIQPSGSRPPLFFLPSLVGDVWYARAVALHLSPDRPVYGIQPKLENDQPVATVETIAARYVEVLRTFKSNGPYHLAGYSFSGLVAYEMARQLAARGSPVGLVALLDTSPRPLVHGSMITAAFLRNLVLWLVDDLLQTRPPEILARLRRHARAARKAGRSFFSSSPTGHLELEALFPVNHLPASYRAAIEANLRASREYVCRAYPGRVMLLRARTRPLFRPLQGDLGWGKLAAGGVDLRVLPGHHASILREPSVRLLGRHLQDALERTCCHASNRN